MRRWLGVRDGVGDPLQSLLNQELVPHDSVGLEGDFDLEDGCFWSFWGLLRLCDWISGLKFNP